MSAVCVCVGGVQDEPLAAEWSASCAVGESSEGSLLCIFRIGACDDEDSWKVLEDLLCVEL